MLKRRKLKQYIGLTIFFICIFITFTNENICVKLFNYVYKLSDFLESYRSKDSRLPQFNLINSNHLCLLPDLDYKDKNALNFLKSDSVNLNSLFERCETNDIHDINNYLTIKNDDINEVYKLELNVSLIETKFQVLDKSHLECSIQLFDKKMNESEELQMIDMIGSVFKFSSENNFILYLNQTGYYYLNCMKIGLINMKLFDHVYTVYPYKMLNLVRKHEYHRKIVENFISKFNNSNDNIMLRDINFKSCENQKSSLNDTKMNVLIIGIDSMSVNHFKRIFPLTYKYLNSKTLIFNHMNSVGTNTYPNIVSMFTGIVEETNPDLNVSSEIEYYRQLDSTYHDHLPFIWKEYEKIGYVTMYQEDDPSIAIFNYLKKGYRYWPTSLYERGNWLKYYAIRSGPDKCHFKQPTYLTWLKQIDDFIEQMNSNDFNRKTPYFSFNFFTEYTHNFLAIPWQFDFRLKEMLVKFEKKSYLNNTMLILMGDHGNRLKYYAYATEQGKLERWMPFLSIKLPDMFKNTVYFKKAFDNQNKLLSFFDLYQTLRHYLHINKKGFESEPLCQQQFRTNSNTNRNYRGISIFSDIPVNRSCADAFIPSKCCNCFNNKEITELDFIKHSNGESFLDVSLKVVDHINELTRIERKKCVPFKLNQMISFKRLIINNIEIFKSVIVLEPGTAWFESNFRFVNKLFRLYDNPSRLSPYGNQSICIKDPILVNYCFCH